MFDLLLLRHSQGVRCGGAHGLCALPNMCIAQHAGKHPAASQPEDADVAVYGGSARARTAATELNAADCEDEDATAAPAAKRRRTAAGAAHGVVEMSGEPPQGEGPTELQVGPFGLPLIDEGLPQVNTNDPFEEAAVIRKATKIKVVGTHVPPPLRSFAEVYSK